MKFSQKYYCPICGLKQTGKYNCQIIEHDKISHVVNKIAIICKCGFKSLIRVYPYEGVNSVS